MAGGDLDGMSPQVYIQEGVQSQPIGTYPLAKGQGFQRHQVGFTQEATLKLPPALQVIVKQHKKARRNRRAR
ncbi:MAG TPA: hypothetical protein VFM46_14320 [Pseudomonadales bacterium]|nr:hypothetical protein [Pseudomonadales bacterium]